MRVERVGERRNNSARSASGNCGFRCSSTRKAAGDNVALREILHRIVLELDGLGGEEGTYGCFLETDEREELVPHLLEVMRACGLDVGDDDPTEPYRRW